LFVKDPETGQLMRGIEGAQDEWYGSDYDAYSYDGGSYDYAPTDYDYGSWSPSDYNYAPEAPAYTGIADVLRDTSYSSDPYYSNLAADPSASIASTLPWYSGFLPTFGGGGGTGGGSASPWLAAALGTAGPLASLIGSLASGGQTGATMPKLGTAQRAQIEQANQALQPFGLGQTPLQMQQQSLLSAIAAGQIPPQITNLVRAAYDPVMQNIWTQATEAGRRAGFHDAPATGPVGGAILGPSLARAQGQMAGDIMGLMTSLPGIYNQPIATAAGAAANQSGNLLRAAGLGTGQTTSVPLGQVVGQGLGSVLSGAAQGYGQSQAQQATQKSYEDLLRTLRGTNSSLSGTY
jgi:hypothetical protein